MFTSHALYSFKRLLYVPLCTVKELYALYYECDPVGRCCMRLVHELNLYQSYVDLTRSDSSSLQCLLPQCVHWCRALSFRALSVCVRLRLGQSVSVSDPARHRSLSLSFFNGQLVIIVCIPLLLTFKLQSKLVKPSNFHLLTRDPVTVHNYDYLLSRTRSGSVCVCVLSSRVSLARHEHALHYL